MSNYRGQTRSRIESAGTLRVMCRIAPMRKAEGIRSETVFVCHN